MDGLRSFRIPIGFLLVATSIFSQDNSLVFPDWEEGILELHHINTGRGDAAFMIFPDATTLLIDAGDMSETRPRTRSVRNAALRPNNSKSAPEWIVSYIYQFFPKNASKRLDYALVTHYHADHFGEMDTNRTWVAEGGYYRTGMTEVGTLLPINVLLDRGTSFPVDLHDASVQKVLDDGRDYGYLATLRNYWAFIGYQKMERGLIHETLDSGRNDQIKLQNSPQGYPKFKVQNIAVNGRIWTGEKNRTYSLYPEGNYPGENPLSTCIKITYGAFDYFTGGDISGIDAFGGTDLNSVETHIAPIVGAVDVATLNHHGNRDSQNLLFVRSLRPRVWIQQNWSSDHPGEEVLRRIDSKELYPGDRDIFSTVMLQANKEVIGDRLDAYKSQKGHIVVRVYDSGAKYEIYILDDASEKREVLSKFGPYEAR